MQPPDDDLLARAKARVGSVLRGKYRLDAVLGVGGMAAVYKASHRNKAEFAVKVLFPEYSGTAIRERFFREGYAANSVKHPGVVFILDEDVAEDGSAFLVMELLKGVGCEDLWTGHARRLPPDLAVDVGVQLLEVLEAAHEKRIFHRDVKPANLFIQDDGAVKLLDFGIAQARDAAQAGLNVTGSNVIMGTPMFMAPEQARGNARDVDARTDVWAAAATLFTMIAGVPVHGKGSPAELMIRTGTQAARPLTAVAPGAPPEIASVIDRALASASQDRWQSAAAMRDALVLAHQNDLGGEPSRARLAKAVRRVREAKVTTLPEAGARDVKARADEPDKMSDTLLAATAPYRTPEPRLAPPSSAATSHPRAPSPSFSDKTEVLAQRPVSAPEFHQPAASVSAPAVSPSAPDAPLPLLAAPRERGRWPAALGGAALGLALTAIALVGVRAILVSEPPPADPAVSAPSVASASFPVVPAPSAALTQDRPPAAAAAPDPGLTPPTARPSKPPPAARPPRTTTSADPTNDCSPRYYFDDAGIKHWKDHCFTK